MTITRHTVLESRHKALGSPLGDWNGMDMPWEYDQDINDEHRAVRTAAGLFDVSGLKKVHIVGPDAIAVMDHVCTRDMTKVYPGKSVYGLILNEEGRVTDDCIAFHMSPNVVMMVYGGGGTGMEQLKKSAEGKDVKIEFDDDLHNISLQGQQALPFLDEHTPYNLAELKYFHQVPTTLFGEHCVISRTGYSGERGYEIFAKADATVKLWDTILEKGASVGIIHCSFNCIDMIRVEAGLLFYPYDMNEENTPWELGLGFAVAKNKADFRGKEAAMASIGKEKIRTFGIVADCDTAVDADAEIFQDGKKVGRVTAPMYSTVVEKSFALVQLDPELAEPGIKLDVKGKTVQCTATTAPLPLLDPEKKKRSS